MLLIEIFLMVLFVQCNPIKNSELLIIEDYVMKEKIQQDSNYEKDKFLNGIEFEILKINAIIEKIESDFEIKMIDRKIEIKPFVESFGKSQLSYFDCDKNKFIVDSSFTPL